MASALQKIRISTKLFLIAPAFVAPLLALLYFTVRGFDSEIDFARKEIEGARLLGSLSEITESISEARAGAEIPDYAEESTKALLRAQTLLDTLDKELSVFIEKVGVSANAVDDLKNGESAPASIKEQIGKLGEFDGSESNSEIERAYSEIRENLRNITRFIGNESNLILDPDLDSYYLMEISLIGFPNLLERISKGCAGVGAVYADPSSVSEDGSPTFCAMILRKDALAGIDQSLNTAAKKDADFYGENLKLQNLYKNKYPEYKASLIATINAIDEFGDYRSDSTLFKAKLFETSSACMEFIRKTDVFWAETEEVLVDVLEDRIENRRTNKYAALGISLGILVLAMIPVFRISSYITKSFSKIASITDLIADGDIAGAKEAIAQAESTGPLRKIKTKDRDKIKDEAGTLFIASKMMTSNLEALLKRASHSADEVNSGSKRISSSARDLEAVAAEQAASALEVTASGAEISAASKKLVSEMESVLAMSDQMRVASDTGKTDLLEIDNAMNNMIESATEILDKLELIDDKTDNVNEALSIIRKLANETNILSLNASIEAESASGESSGFEVIAKQIRRLAGDTSDAASTIEELTGQTRAAVKQGVLAAEGYGKQAAESSRKVASIVESLSLVAERAQSIAPKFSEATDAVKSQSESASQIKETMSQLSEASKQTRDSLREFNKAAGKLESAAASMRVELEKFKI